jgi:hypothetical protein
VRARVGAALPSHGRDHHPDRVHEEPFVGGLRFSLLLPRAFVQTTVRLSLRLPFVWQLLEPFHDRLAVLVTELLLQQPLELRRPK